MLDGEGEGAIDADDEGSWFGEGEGGGADHDDRSGGGGFGALFVEFKKGFVDDLGDAEEFVGATRGDAVEVGGA